SQDEMQWLAALLSRAPANIPIVHELLTNDLERLDVHDASVDVSELRLPATRQLAIDARASVPMFECLPALEVLELRFDEVDDEVLGAAAAIAAALPGSVQLRLTRYSSNKKNLQSL